MQKIIPDKCPKCNNNQRFHKFGKDKFGHQKYRCLVCKHQFAPDFMPRNRSNKYPPCPLCGKSSFLHHDYRDSPQAHSLFSQVAHMGNPSAIVSDRYSAYKVPVKCFFPNSAHIRVESFKGDISFIFT